MTASPEDWRYSPQEWFRQQDRDAQRDRLKDLETATTSHGKRLDSHDEQLGWQKVAIGLLAWVVLNSKLATWTPEMAETTAQVLKGLLR